MFKCIHIFAFVLFFSFPLDLSASTTEYIQETEGVIKCVVSPVPNSDFANMLLFSVKDDCTDLFGVDLNGSYYKQLSTFILSKYLSKERIKILHGETVGMVATNCLSTHYKQPTEGGAVFNICDRLVYHPVDSIVMIHQSNSN